jgi:hypothetical protein
MEVSAQTSANFFIIFQDAIHAKNAISFSQMQLNHFHLSNQQTTTISKIPTTIETEIGNKHVSSFLSQHFGDPAWKQCVERKPGLTIEDRSVM